MSFFKVTFPCALLVLQCLAQEPVDIDVDNRWPFGREPLNPENQPPISLATLYRELRNQSSEWAVWQLHNMFAAAVNGDEFYKLEVDLSDRHRQTAAVVMKMLLQFPTQEETGALLNRAIVYTLQKLSNSSHLRHPLEVVFDQLDERLRENSNLNATYDRLMADSQNSISTSDRKRYFTRVFNMDAGYFPVKPNFMVIPGNLKLMLREGFREKLQYGGYRSKTTFDEYVLANAIYRLGRTEEHKDEVERIREKVTSEILSLMLKEKLVPFFFETDWFVKEMLLRMERSLNEQPDLRRELVKEKLTIELDYKIENSVGNNSLKNEYSFHTKSQKNITT